MIIKLIILNKVSKQPFAYERSKFKHSLTNQKVNKNEP